VSTPNLLTGLLSAIAQGVGAAASSGVFTDTSSTVDGYSASNPYDLSNFDPNTAPQALPLTPEQSAETGLPIVNWDESLALGDTSDTASALSNDLSSITGDTSLTSSDVLGASLPSLLPLLPTITTSPITSTPVSTDSSGDSGDITQESDTINNDLTLPQGPAASAPVDWSAAFDSPANFGQAVNQSIADTFAPFNNLINLGFTDTTPADSSLSIDTTVYGSPDDPDLDTNTALGIGNSDNPLTSDTVALSSNVAASLGAQPGDILAITDTDGNVHYVAYLDTVPESGRVDIYNPTGSVTTPPYTVASVSNLGAPVQAPAGYAIPVNQSALSAGKLSTAGIALSTNSQYTVSQLNAGVQLAGF
jgi:hypothetical protein